MAKFRDDGGKIGEVELRTFQEFHEPYGSGERRGAQLLKTGVDLIPHFHREGFTPFDESVSLLTLLLHEAEAFGGGETYGGSSRREAHVGVILPEQYAIFGARREHAVRFIHALRHQIVYEHADVSLVPTQHERGLPFHREGRVNSGHQPLSCRLLIAGGAIHLPGEIETGHELRLQIMGELRRVEIIIFYGIAGAIEMHVAERLHFLKRLELHAPRQGAREAVDVEFLSGLPFRLQEKLMTLLVGESDNLRLDARAIARAYALDLAIIERRIGEIVMEDLMHLRISMDNKTAPGFKRAHHVGKERELVEVALH